jgi:hypothetical protein
VNSWLILRTVLLLGVGIGTWFFFRGWHTSRIQRARPNSLFQQAHVLRVPRWLSLLCGRPLPGNELELVAMILQIGSLFLILAIVPAIILGYDYAAVMTVVLGVMCSMALIAQAGASLIKKFGR